MTALRTLLLALVVALGPAASAVAQQTPDAKDQYVPIDQLEPVEQLPAAPLVAAAYSVAWVAILVFVWSIWSRLQKVEKELNEVARRLEPGARR